MSRTRFYVIGFAILAAIDTWTQVAFKFAAIKTGEFVPELRWVVAAAHSPWIYGAIGGYLAAFIAWMTLLKHAPVGPAFAASHLEIVTVLLISIPLFGDRLTAVQIGGAVCIIGGIGLLALSESKYGDAAA